LNQFANALGVVKTAKGAVVPKELNLILAISQIDKLKHGNADSRNVLDILLQPPYILLGEQDESAIKHYFSTMQTVHYDLESWFQANVPDLVKAAERFASVRYCGFSSFGFEPIMKEIRPG